MTQASKPKILHVITHLSLGGAERVAVNLATGLRDEFDSAILAIRGAKHNACGTSLLQEIRAAELPFFSGIPLPMKAGGMLTGAWAIRQAIRSFSPSLVHLHTEIPEASYATYLSFQPTRSPLVIRSIHNAVFWEFWRSLGRFCEKKLKDAHAIAVSDGALKGLQKLRAEVGTRGGHTVRIYNGVAAARIHRADGRKGPRRVIFGGRFEPEKGIDLIPEILRRTPAPTEGAVLDLYGHGRLGTLLATVVTRPPSGWTVRVFPPVGNFRERLADYDVCLVPSRFEGFGLVAVEAMLAGLRVVGTDCPGLDEVLTPSHPWRAKSEDIDALALALRAALDDIPSGAYVPTAAQKARLEEFELTTALHAHRAFYREILSLPVS